jgi:hypothetical protein
MAAVVTAVFVIAVHQQLRLAQPILAVAAVAAVLDFPQLAVQVL